VRNQPVQDLSIGNGYIGLDPWVATLPNRTFNGKIDDVAIFNYSLSPQQISTIFKAGTVGQLNWNKTTQGLVLTWGAGTLLQADNLTGPWTTASGVTSGVAISTTAAHRFYRVQY